jgi:hypothetical protein
MCGHRRDLYSDAGDISGSVLSAICGDTYAIGDPMTSQTTDTHSDGICIKPTGHRGLMRNITVEHDMFDDNTDTPPR